MFSKIKLKKPPISLSNVSNAIKLLGNMEVPVPQLKMMSDIDVYHQSPIGINGPIVAVAHEPIQKLIAVATSGGAIHVLGKGSVEVTFEFDLKSQWIDVRFVRGVYLVAVLTGGITVISLHSKQVLVLHSTGGVITCVALDPACDFVALGLQNGAIVFFDVDRLSVTPTRLDNLQKKVHSKEKLLPVILIEWHPRVPGAILATYLQCAVYYNLASGQLVSYERAGDEKKHMFSSQKQLDNVIQAHFHPNGLHVAVLFADSLILIFDTQQSTFIVTRTFECNPLSFKWLAMKDPEYTQLALAGTSLSVVDLGLTLKYSLTLVDKQANFYKTPREQILLNQRVDTIIPLGYNPYFNGGGDPLWLLTLTNGKLSTVNLIGKHSELVLPQLLLLVCPLSTCSKITSVKRVDWYSVATLQYGSSTADFFSGGKPSTKVIRPIGFDDSLRDLLITGHNNGFIRIVELNNTDGGSQQVLASLPRELMAPILDVSVAIAAKEFIAAIPGKIILYKYGRPSMHGSKVILHLNLDAAIESIPLSEHGSKSFSFYPHSSISLDEEVSSLKVNDTGLAAIAFKTGRILVLDVSRGPAIILNDKLSHYAPSVSDCYGTTLEFLILEYGSEGFSTVILLVGASGGVLINFKVVPQPNGAFECVFADKSIGLSTRDATTIDKIIPVSVKGDLAIGTLDIFQRLATGVTIPGYIITLTARDIRVLRLPKQKLTHKVYEEEITASGIVKFRNGTLLCVVLKLGTTLFLLIPQLNEVTTIKGEKPKKKPSKYDPPEPVIPKTTSLTVLINGEIFVAKSDTTFTSSTTYAKGVRSPEHLTDTLFNENVIYPLKPQTGAAQWLKGNLTIISSEDLTHLIAGPNRRPAKHPESVFAYNISPEANPNQFYTEPNNSSSSGLEEAGYGYKQPTRKANSSKAAGYGIGTGGFMRSLQQGINNVEESFNGYANTLNETVNESVLQGTNSFYLAALKHKAGF